MHIIKKLVTPVGKYDGKEFNALTVSGKNCTFTPQRTKQPMPGRWVTEAQPTLTGSGCNKNIM